MRRELPILVAAFADEAKVDDTMARLEAQNIGPELIGICTRVNGHNGHVHDTVHLLSVLASPRRHDEIEALLLTCDALSVGSAAEMSATFGATPHPGVFEDGGMKLPMGPDYGSRDGGV